MENAKSFLSSLLSAGGASGQGAPAVVVSSIYVYPIKSCRGISLSQAPVSPTGFRWDRQWLVVNSKGRAYTQRVEPKLALVEIEMPNGAFDEGWEPTVDSYMVIKAPGMNPLKVPLVAEYAMAEVSVWEWSGPAHDEGVGAADWFSSYLGKPIRLVRFWTASEIRPVDVKYVQGHKVLFADGYPFMVVSQAPGMNPLKVPLVAEYAMAEVSVWEWSGPAHDEGVGAADWFSSYLGKPIRLVRFWTASEIRPVDVKYVQGHKVLFADGYPFMVVSQGSLNALNEVLHETININRFRPNILVDGCNPYSEDLWKEIKINSLTFNGVKLCARCKVPTINQENGISGTEPTETMMKFRSDHVLRPACKQKGLVYFGQHLVWQDSLLRTMNGKLVKVGDPVYVVREYASCDDAPA